jgi:hypothetical protein
VGGGDRVGGGGGGEAVNSIQSKLEVETNPASLHRQELYGLIALFYRHHIHALTSGITTRKSPLD